MGRVLRKQKKVDYLKAVHKYDGLKFVASGGVTKRRAKVAGQPGRALSAPTLTNWRTAVLHQDVTYYDDIDNSLPWVVPLPNVVRLPFRSLDLSSTDWQGIEQAVPLNGDAQARAHFDSLETTLRVGRSNPTITECVGEAAAAIYMLDQGRGWQMVWGFHLHSGTGIDQIWRRPIGGGRFEYMIIEAKGPGASAGFSPFLPPNYSQMQLGWVINHLHSMSNNHRIGRQIKADLGLQFAVAHPNYGGGSKSYYGFAPTSGHAASGCRLYGRVVEAVWLSDGRLGYTAGKLITYV